MSFFLRKSIKSNGVYLQICETVYNKETKSSSNKNFKIIGYADSYKHLYDDPIKHFEDVVKEMNLKAKEDKNLKVSSSNPVTKNIGYFLVKALFNTLNVKKDLDLMGSGFKFEKSISDFIETMVFCQIVKPSSKLKNAQEIIPSLYGVNSFSEDQIYRMINFVGTNYKKYIEIFNEHVKKLFGRNYKHVFFDCTNYYFEIEKEDNLRRYGKSKEHRPNPIVQMGMFMDADGLPLAFCINPGNTNEQQTMQPLEEILANEFNLSEFVVCTDAGLASIDNRIYNTSESRNYVVTQSIPQLPKLMKEWAVDKTGWKRLGDQFDHTYDISDLNLNEEKNNLYYKERWFKENRSNVKDFEERLIVTFSPKYALYQRQLRMQHIDKALKMIERKSEKSRQTQQDPRRLISTAHYSDDGIVAENTVMSLDVNIIEQEKALDGLNCMATRLEDSVSKILHVNGYRYEIEHLFRITKTEFDARPVYLRREDRIRAHFAICFVALLLLKAFQRQVNEGRDETDHYSTEQIIEALSGMDYNLARGVGYVPAYSATLLRLKCCEVAQIPIDRQIVMTRKMNKIIKSLRNVIIS